MKPIAANATKPVIPTTPGGKTDGAPGAPPSFTKVAPKPTKPSREDAGTPKPGDAPRTKHAGALQVAGAVVELATSVIPFRGLAAMGAIVDAVAGVAAGAMVGVAAGEAMGATGPGATHVDAWQSHDGPDV